MIPLAIDSTTTINNDTVQINNLETNQLLSLNNGILNTINSNDDTSISGNINFNNTISLPNLSLINIDLIYIIIDQDNKIWKTENNISQEKITLNAINAYQNNLTINNTNNTIIFNSDTTTNTININEINQIINSNSHFTELNCPSTYNKSFNIFGNNTTGSITTDNNTIVTILSPIINSDTINGKINMIMPEGILTMSNNYLLNITNINDINNYRILTINNENQISNTLIKYTNIYNQDILNVNSPRINLNNSDIILKTYQFNSPDSLLSIDNNINVINFKKLNTTSSKINKGIFKGDNITGKNLQIDQGNTKFTASGKDFIFNNLVNSSNSYLVFAYNTLSTTTGTQLVLDANEELFYLAQSSREFKENIRPLSISSDRFLEILQNIEQIHTNEDLIRTLENTELHNIIIYDENKEPSIIEERGLMAIAAAQLNNINDSLQALEKELGEALNN